MLYIALLVAVKITPLQSPFKFKLSNGYLDNAQEIHFFFLEWCREIALDKLISPFFSGGREKYPLLLELKRSPTSQTLGPVRWPATVLG
jgi:hypothetical protein